MYPRVCNLFEFSFTYSVKNKLKIKIVPWFHVVLQWELRGKRFGQGKVAADFWSKCSNNWGVLEHLSCSASEVVQLFQVPGLEAALLYLTLQYAAGRSLSVSSTSICMQPGTKRLKRTNYSDLLSYNDCNPRRHHSLSWEILVPTFSLALENKLTSWWGGLHETKVIHIHKQSKF